MSLFNRTGTYYLVYMIKERRQDVGHSELWLEGRPVVAGQVKLH